MRTPLKILLLLISVSFVTKLNAQYELGGNSYGMIMNNDSSALSGVIGSGFAIDSNIIVSSYDLFKHIKPTHKFYRVPYNKTAPVKLIDSLPEYDIAILKSRYFLTDLPMTLGEFKRSKKGDRISYVGYDKKGASIYCVGFITKIDSIKSNGVWLDRLTFSTNELPCHPGSPIVNSKGKTIAMVISPASRKRDGQLTGIIAYSIMQLKLTRYEGF